MIEFPESPRSSTGGSLAAEMASTPRALLYGLGTSLPGKSVCQEEGIRIAQRLSSQTPQQAKKIAAVYRRSGIKHRGSVLFAPSADDASVVKFYPSSGASEDRGPGTQQRNERYVAEAPILATEASQQALANANLPHDQVTHLVTVSCTGFSAPGIDIALIDQLNLPKTTQRIQIGFMGCHGMINALRTAQALAMADSNAKVLICSVELCSLHYQYGFDADRIVSGALFADGAAAMVVQSSDTSFRSDDHAVAMLPIRIVATGSCLVGNSQDAMTWKIGDHGFEMTLSTSVPNLIETQLPSFLSDWLDQYDESIDSIGGWAVHPGGTRILAAVENALSLPADALTRSREVLMQCGNMSSATMAFVLQRFIRDDVPRPWLMLGFGPGLEIEVALIR